jgi:hypothetical protein
VADSSAFEQQILHLDAASSTPATTAFSSLKQADIRGARFPLFSLTVPVNVRADTMPDADGPAGISEKHARRLCNVIHSVLRCESRQHTPPVRQAFLKYSALGRKQQRAVSCVLIL